VAERVAPEDGTIELPSPQGSRLWVAVWVAFGAILLAAALILIAGEAYFALRGPLVEAIFSARRS
jgi:hypothetical protein